MAIEYITTRNLENSSGKITGKIRIIKNKGESKANVEYICPECNFTENKKEVWKKPFSIRCSKCGYLIKVPSLRTEIKKMRKQN
jgi:ssDNA-binding Zn-finger/Zn-ribbon topoisomerase 1